jgi:hypothetical protein
MDREVTGAPTELEGMSATEEEEAAAEAGRMVYQEGLVVITIWVQVVGRAGPAGLSELLEVVGEGQPQGMVERVVRE